MEQTTTLGDLLSLLPIASIISIIGICWRGISFIKQNTKEKIGLYNKVEILDKDLAQFKEDTNKELETVKLNIKEDIKDLKEDLKEVNKENGRGIEKLAVKIDEMNKLLLEFFTK